MTSAIPGSLQKWSVPGCGCKVHVNWGGTGVEWVERCRLHLTRRRTWVWSKVRDHRLGVRGEIHRWGRYLSLRVRLDLWWVRWEGGMEWELMS